MQGIVLAIITISLSVEDMNHATAILYHCVKAFRRHDFTDLFFGDPRQHQSQWIVFRHVLYHAHCLIKTKAHIPCDGGLEAVSSISCLCEVVPRLTPSPPSIPSLNFSSFFRSARLFMGMLTSYLPSSPECTELKMVHRKIFLNSIF